MLEERLWTASLVFRLKDGSLHDEKVAFSQQRVFTRSSYRLVQRGPSFPEQIDISVNRGTAEYTVRSQDVYNGMLIAMTKNLQKGVDETVSLLAFTPAPQVVKVQLHAEDEQPILISDVFWKCNSVYVYPANQHD